MKPITTGIIIPQEVIRNQVISLLQKHNMTGVDFLGGKNTTDGLTFVEIEKLTEALREVKLVIVQTLRCDPFSLFLMGAGYAYNRVVVSFDNNIIRDTALNQVIYTIKDVEEFDEFLSIFKGFDFTDWDKIGTVAHGLSKFLGRTDA